MGCVGGAMTSQVLLERDPQAVPVVRPAEEHRVLVWLRGC